MQTTGTTKRAEGGGSPTGWAIELAERGWVPDPLLRFGIRRLLRERRIDLERARNRSRGALAVELSAGPIALHADRANRQHYEVPTAFFREVLGPRLKYSCALFDDGGRDLAGAEEAMLELTARRAGVTDGMRVLDLGCGWGSFSLWLAERFPRCAILAVSNSKHQGEWIRSEARRRGFENVSVHTADVSRFDPADPGGTDAVFDRIVSVEMFEHVRNWDALLDRAAGWLAPGGRLFLHTFCHRDRAYPFEDRGDGDWMARHFFSGGLMPSADWVLWHQRRFEVVDQWLVDGRHYQATAEAWLAKLDRRWDRAGTALREAGEADPERALRRWRLFFLAVSELFGTDRGREWFVQHALLAPREDRS